MFNHREYNINRYRAKRAHYMKLLGGVCVVCGTSEELQFDHIDRSTKTIDIGKLLNYSKAVIDKEITKCQLLCRQHHIEKGKLAGDQGQVAHGQGVSGKKNCKCELCKARKAEYMREWQRNRKLAGVAGVD